MISIICATSANGIIGAGNTLPWRLSADLKRFKKLTMGHAIIMGRKTYESIGKALPGRTNIVVTRNPNFKAEGCHVAHSLKDAIALCKGDNEIFIIGGASIYREAVSLAGRLYLTTIHKDFEGDTRMFKINPAEWREIQKEDVQPDATNPFSYSFAILEK